jgi:nicotinate phosphoribosyltransferase
MNSLETSAKRRLRPHLTPPLPELRAGYHTDVYFRRAKQALEAAGRRPKGLMQVFQKKDAVLCGMGEALAILAAGSGHYRDDDQADRLFAQWKQAQAEAGLLSGDPSIRRSAEEKRLGLELELDDLWESAADDLKVEALADGDEVASWETALTIEGEIPEFVQLETLYLGVLARRTKIATKASRVVAAAGDKPVLYFPARFDHWAIQEGDGHAARAGGVFAVSTDAQAAWWGEEGEGTIPHALIAAVEGDTVESARLFNARFPDTNLIALVDFHNDSIETSLAVAREMGDRLWGVRLDTSEKLTDKSLQGEPDADELRGVQPRLVEKVRQALDAEGFDHVKIVVSGGFNVEKIAAFERDGVPADAYGVGSSLLEGRFDFTADIVEIEGRHAAKVGRKLMPNPRLLPINLSALNV